MYKIVNLATGDYLRLYTFDSVPGFSYYWHESLITVNGEADKSEVAIFPDEISPEYYIDQALTNYKIRRDMFKPYIDHGTPDYQPFEFEVIKL